MAEKLTAKSLRDLAGPPEGRPYVIHFDSELPGFGVRITQSGARSLILNYRARGVERRMTLGSILAGDTAERIDRLIVEKRREAARFKSDAKHHGSDPVAEREAERARPTVRMLVDHYKESHLPTKRASSQAEDRYMLDNVILPELGGKRVADVAYDDVNKIHRKLSKTTPIRANRTLALLSKMFTEAILLKWCEKNPTKGVKRNDEVKRKRFLDADELKKVSTELAKHPRQASANAVRLLLLTGARRGEVLGATWAQFDLEKGVWTKPSSHTKTKIEHHVPLSGPARLLVSEMRSEAEKAAKKAKIEVSPYLFPSRKGQAQKALRRFWAVICEGAGLKDVHIHDLRHSYASSLASAGFSLPTIGALLGHTNPSTTQRYAHLQDEPLRAATERVARVMSGKAGKSADVVPIGKRKRQ